MAMSKFNPNDSIGAKSNAEIAAYLREIGDPDATDFEPTDLARYGFAPGMYIHTHCRDCGDEFWADKRAWRCQRCAQSISDKLARLPHYIAICGHPGSGKSTVQAMLASHWHIQAVDDGAACRAIGRAHFGLTMHQVETQDGKAEVVEVNGDSLIVRDVLGRIARGLESEFGPWTMPWLATRGLDPQGHYSFASVRRDQGEFYHGIA